MERKTKTHPHAVATKTVDATRSNSYSYDALDNMVTRNYWQPDLATASWVQHNQALQYNPENKLTSVQEGGATIASFVYDGTGSRVLGTVNGETIAYVGTHYEVNVTSGAVTKYYGGNALKKNGNLQYLFKDHLGSVVGSLDANSGVIESQRAYKPFGDDLLMRGTIPTTLAYTGQRQEPELGLYYYNARWYDPYLGRFTQADTIVPNPTDAKAFDRYAYVYNNPVRYNDPSGHYICKSSNGAVLFSGDYASTECWEQGGQIFEGSKYFVDTEMALSLIDTEINALTGEANALKEFLEFTGEQIIRAEEEESMGEFIVAWMLYVTLLPASGLELWNAVAFGFVAQVVATHSPLNYNYEQAVLTMREIEKEVWEKLDEVNKRIIALQQLKVDILNGSISPVVETNYRIAYKGEDKDTQITISQVSIIPTKDGKVIGDKIVLNHYGLSKYNQKYFILFSP
jgi:RHS repeat-associated protein